MTRNDRIAAELKKVEALARVDSYGEALRSVDALVASHPNEPAVWATRGYVNALQGDHWAAISDLSKCIELDTREPDHFFTRGRFLFKVERYREAIADFTRVLELCDTHNSDYYRPAAYLFRADAYVRLREYAKARADCDCVLDKGPIWTNQLRTRDEILAECP